MFKSTLTVTLHVKLIYSVIFSALWATKMTEDTQNNQEMKIKTTLRELIVYLVFLVILCVGEFSLLATCINL